MTETATGARQADPSKEAVVMIMHQLTGRAAVERCIRAHGAEPPEDGKERARAHLEAHGAEVTERAVRWPVPQSPSLTTLLGGHRRTTSAQMTAAVSRQELAAREEVPRG